MSMDTLLDVLHGLPIAGEPLKDLPVAKQFVLNYLYNQDVVTADVIIKSEIHDHFRLKASFLKSLNQVYKDASKAYQASKNAKRAKAGTVIPDWYEPNDKGLRFLPGVLAKNLSDEQKVFYAAEQHFCYRGGVYVELSEMEAQRLVQEKMLVRETKMGQIIDAEKQWRLLVQKDIRELNKVADRIAGAIVDLAYKAEKDPRIAVEVLMGHGVCYVVVETCADIFAEQIKRIVHRIAGPMAVLCRGKCAFADGENKTYYQEMYGR